MSIFRAFILIVSLFLLFACSANGMKYSELPQSELAGKSEIVVFRKNQLAASGGCYRVNVDGEQIGVLANGGYVRKVIEPGKHTVSIVLKKGLDLEIETKENETNFIQYLIGLGGMSVFPVGTISAVNMTWKVSLVVFQSDIA